MARKAPTQRGLESYQEQDSNRLIRDTRTLGQRIADFLSEADSVTGMLIFFVVVGFIFPAYVDLLFIAGVSIYFYQRTRKITLPFRLPQFSGQIDYGDLKPGSKEYNRARGIAFLGNDRKTNEELWFSNDDLRTHVLIFGSTGSGKTEALVSIAYNALVYGSGFIYVDGKGDNSLFAKIFSMARSMGREDDLLIINFMTGARDIVGRQEKKISNTLNPFSNGSSSMLSQLVVSMMDSASASPDGDMWKGRAISFVEALMKILVYMRDQGHILLDAHTTRLYFSLEKLESIVVDKLFPREHQEPVPLYNVPEVVMQPISHYLDNLPGYDKNKKGKQVSQVLEQHGFITMQLTRVFTSLADTYGHILRVKLAEVDLKDVVLNRRILVVLLPALEKAPDELANLGKVIISTLKAMMSAGLGSEVEGSYRELISRKPTNALTPFMCILDEYGYYAIEGFAVVPAQARSLGFSAIFAGQDLPAFQKASKEEAASIGANTNIKICMKLEDPTETWEFFSKTAGESYVTKVDTFQTNSNSIMNNYMDTRSSSAEKRQRIDLLDLKEQREGEAHIFFKSRIVRAQMFYASPPPSEEMRLNHFLRVEPPPTKMLVELEQREKHFNEAVSQVDTIFATTNVPIDEDLQLITKVMSDTKSSTAVEAAMMALQSFQQKNAPPVVEEDLDDMPFNQMNLFTPFRLTDPLVPMLMGEQFEAFSKSIVSRNEVKACIERLERLLGKTGRHAANISNELLDDMISATFYPPDNVPYQEGSEMATFVRELTAKVQAKVTAEAGINETE
jgi:intracellular multiplication protein IcmO